MREDIYFVPIIYFNNSVIDELVYIIKDRGFINSNNSQEFVFQARILVYVNFNQYLNLLLIRQGEEKFEESLYDLEKSEDSEDLFNILLKYTNKNKKEIIEGFLKYFKK